jgi:hypothetical protein
MSRIPGRRPEDAKPIQEAWINPPALTLIDGPYSLMMWDRTAKDPDDPSREYHWDHFDVVRGERQDQRALGRSGHQSAASCAGELIGQRLWPGAVARNRLTHLVGS